MAASSKGSKPRRPSHPSHLEQSDALPGSCRGRSPGGVPSLVAVAPSGETTSSPGSSWRTLCRADVRAVYLVWIEPHGLGTWPQFLHGGFRCKCLPLGRTRSWTLLAKWLAWTSLGRRIPQRESRPRMTSWARLRRGRASCALDLKMSSTKSSCKAVVASQILCR